MKPPKERSAPRPERRHDSTENRPTEQEVNSGVEFETPVKLRNLLATGRVLMRYYNGQRHRGRITFTFEDGSKCAVGEADRKRITASVLAALDEVIELLDLLIAEEGGEQ